MKKYRLICGLLVASILTNACSSPTLPTQAQSQGNEPFSTFTIGVGSYEKEAEVSVASSSSSPSSDSGGGFGEFLGTLLGFVLVGAIVGAASGSGSGDSDYGGSSDMTDIERKTGGNYMTRTQYREYYAEHPETWTPVYVIPSE